MRQRRLLALAGFVLVVAYVILLDRFGDAKLQATAEPMIILAGVVVGFMLYVLFKPDNDNDDDANPGAK